MCYNMLCWRWPFLIEVALIAPLSLAIFLVPKELISVKVIHGNSARKKQKLQLHLQSVIRSYSNSSFGDRKDRGRCNSAQIENSQSKPPNSASNRYFSSSLSGNFSSQKTPLGYRAETEYSARKNNGVNNSNSEQLLNNSTSSTKSKTVKSSPTVIALNNGEKISTPFPAFPEISSGKESTGLTTSHSDKDGSNDILNSKFKESNLQPDIAHDSQTNITYCGLALSNKSRLKSYDDLSIFGSEKYTSEENSENDFRLENFHTPEGHGERSSRRRLRNQVRT